MASRKSSRRQLVALNFLPKSLMNNKDLLSRLVCQLCREWFTCTVSRTVHLLRVHNCKDEESLRIKRTKRVNPASRSKRIGRKKRPAAIRHPVYESESETTSEDEYVEEQDDDEEPDVDDDEVEEIDVLEDEEEEEEAAAGPGISLTQQEWEDWGWPHLHCFQPRVRLVDCLKRRVQHDVITLGSDDEGPSTSSCSQTLEDPCPAVRRQQDDLVKKDIEEHEVVSIHSSSEESSASSSEEEEESWRQDSTRTQRRIKQEPSPSLGAHPKSFVGS